MLFSASAQGLAMYLFFPRALGDFTPESQSKRQRCEKKNPTIQLERPKTLMPRWEIGAVGPSLSHKWFGSMLPTAKAGKRRNDIDHEFQIGPVHLMLINGFFQQNRFNGIPSTIFDATICYDNIVVFFPNPFLNRRNLWLLDCFCFASGHRQLYTITPA